MQRSQRFPLLRISEMRSKPITARGRQITPIGRAIQVNWRGGVFLWQQPVAVEISQGDEVRRLTIQNATRRATTSIMLAGLGIVVLAASLTRLKNARKGRSL